ncbi:MAG: hypothetical protein GF344_13895 [Chitinivibrionales bacterium]|nr:hypothetical protein [Chitinivibrionales bacterium]MBD3357816.1 hypothetical protein [Chitinivibrionales bacterium]
MSDALIPEGQNVEAPQNPPVSIAERRRYTRYPLALKLYTRDERALNEKLCNISLGGLCFRSPNELHERDYVYIRLATADSDPDERLKFSVVAKVCRVEELSKGYYQYGAQHAFYDDPFSDQMKTKLKRVIERYNN